MATLNVRQQGLFRTLTWLGLLGVAALALAAIVMTADATAEEQLWLLLALLSTGAAGIGVARGLQLLLPRLSLRTQLALATVTGFLVLMANLAVASALMFISTHDLQMLFLLSAYALLITLGPARLLSGGLSGRIEAIEAGARRLASGELGARVNIEGSDELAALAREFNRMADALDVADQQRQAVEASRRDLFAAISHDLRTPLASIRVRVEALLDGVVTDEATRTRYLEGACTEVEHLSALIDDLFELTTLDSGELQLRLEMLPVQDVIAEAVDIFRPQVEKADPPRVPSGRRCDDGAGGPELAQPCDSQPAAERDPAHAE
ncbi:MAG: histidine kinase dimerization/phospho-acceptor domain-containing protein [Dehalococcoidia bacterium]